MTPCRVALFVTALPVEYDAVRAHLADIEEVVHPEGTVYEIGSYAAHDVMWKVVILEAGMGNVPAAVETERAIAKFQPEAAFFVGVAGGLKDVDLGDVVVGRAVYGYESGKAAGTFLPRGDVELSSYRLVQRAMAEARKGSWRLLIKSPPLKEPHVRVGKIAAGEKVVANAKSAVCKMLAELYSDALAVEMEGRGFLRATYANDSVRSIVIRGISDLLDNKSESDEAGTQLLAASNASAFAFNLLTAFSASQLSTEETVDSGGDDEVLADFYRAWISERTSTFYVPALGIDLPSASAFATLVVRPKQDDDEDTDDEDGEPKGHKGSSFVSELTRYHAPVERSGRKEIDAQELVTRRRLVAIVGGPGAGKTTLAKLLIHNATRNGKIAHLVPLKRLLPRQSNESFDSALRRVATIETGLEGVENLKPDVIVCDGLDECEPARAEVARDLAAWAKDHPASHVVVTTRRLGHHASLLPGFLDADLPHLEFEEAHSLAGLLVDASVRKESDRVTFRKRVAEALIEQGRIGGVAHRSPLLLSFVVRLVLDGTAIASNRVKLFADIIEVIRTSPPAGRISVDMEAASAMRIAEMLAFAIIEDPRQSSLQLIRKIAADLRGASADALEERVEQAIRFWEERRLIERIRLGAVESFTFIHLSFAEYLASVRIAAMSPEELLVWIGTAHRQSRWRESILFSAVRGDVERYVRALLESADSTDVVEIGPLLATDIIVESGGAAAEVMDDLIAALSLRLESNFRTGALETAATFAKLVQFARLPARAAVTPLRNHAQLWTRIAAIGIAAVADDETISADEARAFLDAFHTPAARHERGMLVLMSSSLRSTPDLFQPAVGPLSKILLLSENTNTTRDYLADRVFEDASDESLDAVLKAAEPFGDAAWFALRVEKWKSQWSEMARWPTNPDFEKNFLLWLLNVLEPNVPLSGAAAGPGSYPLIARLYSALQLMHAPVGELSNYPRTPITPSVRETFKGVLGVLAIDSKELAGEIRRAVAYLQSSDRMVFLEVGDDFEPPVDWRYATKCALDGALLIEALGNRRVAIMRVAALLLAHVAWSPERIADLRELLRTGSRSTMRAVAWILVTAAHLDEAFEALTSRLREESTGGCGDLYEFLAELHPRADAAVREKIESVLFDSLKNTHSYAARGAARAIRSLRLPNDAHRDTQLIDAFSAWQSGEIRCFECDRVTAKTSCESCHYSLPTPRAPILRELVRRGIVPPLTELVTMFASPWTDLQKAAKIVARERLEQNPAELCDAANAIADAKADSKLTPLIPIILQLGADLLLPLKSVLLRLAERGEHLSAFLDSLQSGWLTTSEAEAICRQALMSSDSVAEKALKELRAIKAR